jgi:hypothetical protein
MCPEDVSVSRRTWLLGWFLGPRVLVFDNSFCSSSSLCTLRILASAVELHFEDDMWDTRDEVFVNGLSVRSTLFAYKMSVSAVDLGFEDDIWDSTDAVFISYLSVRSSLFAQKMWASTVELCFLDEFLGPRVLVFVNGLSICAEDVSVNRKTGLFGWFFGSGGPSFRQRFLSQQ